MPQFMGRLAGSLIIVPPGLTCQHVSKAVDLSSVKKAVTQNLWSVCTDCLRERTVIEGEPAGDVLLCLRCGFQVR